MVETVLIERGVFLDLATLDAGDLDFTQLDRQLPQLQYRQATSTDELIGVLKGMEVVLCNKTVLDRKLLQANPQLKLICLSATGFNNIDVVAAHEQGIAVSNVRAYATPSVVQHVFAMILALTTRLCEVQQAVALGEWTRSPHFSLLNYPIHELAGKTLGIVGYGELGRAVANVASCFGMKVLIARRNDRDQRPERLLLHELLPQVDVLSLHCPLNDETRHLIDEDELALMKPSAILINTARGGIVNEAALLSALKHKTIAGAGCDVLSQEPPPSEHPMLQYHQPNLIITPHVAWASLEARQRCVNEMALNIAAFKRGETRNRV
ncbi:MAG: 2-hydroxyacid dehydrogenase [Gammaproteobacteria bacterium]|nr:MAG: 2-hydroxyacid dehydrogenase [Gammaproteobacteria bacterium]